MATRMSNPKVWTLEELHSLPDDGNRYELVHGELFVTPAPTNEHEEIAARLARILDPYVEANRLGYVFRPRAIIQLEGSEVEPDLMVRRHHPRGWATAPLPILVIEILSPPTRRRDREHKRDFYIDDVTVPEYWIVDPERREIIVAKPRVANEIARDRLVWSAAGTTSPLVVDVGRVFQEETTTS
jgi:Uma2 family endonuclease